MNCNDCARFLAALDGGLPADHSELRAHATQCASCRAELEASEQVAHWAAARRQAWESPALWPSIESALRAGPARPRIHFLPTPRAWAAIAALLVLTVPMVWYARLHHSRPIVSDDFLTAQTLQQVESARAAYVQSIEQLNKLAKPALNNDNLRAMAAYRDKLQLLDKAIAETRAAAAGNRLNAQVQAQLAALLQDKQNTLQEVLKYANSNENRL